MKVVLLSALVASVGVVAAGIYLRWAVAPVMLAFWAGRQVGRELDARKTPAG